MECPKNSGCCTNALSFDYNHDFCERIATENTSWREETRKEWPGFCIADSVYTLEAQGSRARVQWWKTLPVGKHTRPPGLPRKIRRVHGSVRQLLLDALGPVQKLHQGISASTRPTKIAGTLIEMVRVFSGRS